MISREFQSTSFTFRSPAIKTGIPPSIQAERYNSIWAQEGESETAGVLTCQLANIICMAVPSRCLRFCRVECSDLYLGRSVLLFRRLKDFSWPEMCLSQEAYINFVLAGEKIQLQFRAENSVSVPAGQLQGFLPVRLPRPCCHTRLQKGQQFSG